MSDSLPRANRKGEDYDVRRRKAFCATLSKKNHRLWIKPVYSIKSVTAYWKYESFYLHKQLINKSTYKQCLSRFHRPFYACKLKNHIRILQVLLYVSEHCLARTTQMFHTNQRSLHTTIFTQIQIKQKIQKPKETTKRQFMLKISIITNFVHYFKHLSTYYLIIQWQVLGMKV